MGGKRVPVKGGWQPDLVHVCIALEWPIGRESAGLKHRPSDDIHWPRASLICLVPIERAAAEAIAGVATDAAAGGPTTREQAGEVGHERRW